MKHFYQISNRQFLKINTGNLSVSEKIDGSFMSVGKDDSGFYLKTKTRTFRNVYEIENISLWMYKQFFWYFSSYSNEFKNGDFIDFEILYGYLPNSIPRKSPTNTLVITNSNIDILKNEIQIAAQIPVVDDNLQLTLVNKIEIFTVVKNKVFNDTPILTLLSQYIEEIQAMIIDKIPKKDIDDKKIVYNGNIISYYPYIPSQFDFNFIEGGVYTDGNITFKIMDGDNFHLCNNYTHIWRNYLFGRTKTEGLNYLIKSGTVPKTELDEAFKKYLQFSKESTIEVNGSYISYKGFLDQKTRLYFYSIKQEL
jgi:hypothetical protein